MSLLKPHATVLFIGDSITDAGRGMRGPDDLGDGYAAVAAHRYSASQPADEIRFLNRGTSGNRVRDLRDRWRVDCLDLSPDVVSIMIGVNDTWRRYDRGDPTPVEEFEHDYREILARTRDGLGATVVLIEPFLLPLSPEQATWREDLDPKIAVVHGLAEEFEATLVPLDALLTREGLARTPADLVADGVHPTATGHAFIAEVWLDAVT